MGWPNLPEAERAAKNEADAAARLAANQERSTAINQRKQAQAEQIVDDILDLIVVEVIRPGPKQEERECTKVAQEAKELRGRMVQKTLAKL